MRLHAIGGQRRAGAQSLYPSSCPLRQLLHPLGQAAYEPWRPTSPLRPQLLPPNMPLSLPFTGQVRLDPFARCSIPQPDSTRRPCRRPTPAIPTPHGDHSPTGPRTCPRGHQLVLYRVEGMLQALNCARNEPPAVHVRLNLIRYERQAGPNFLPYKFAGSSCAQSRAWNAGGLMEGEVGEWGPLGGAGRQLGRQLGWLAASWQQLLYLGTSSRHYDRVQTAGCVHPVQHR